MPSSEKSHEHEKNRKIRLWIFNHAFRGISDQLDFLLLTLKRSGFSVCISNNPCPESLNIVIENLNERSARVINQFCETYKKRIAVVMTEHIDWVDGKIYFHGRPINSPGHYMHSMSRHGRLLHLMICKKYIRCFLRLGDLPELKGIEELFPGVPVETLPYPSLPLVIREEKNLIHYNYDFIFSGALTPYRRGILNEIDKKFVINTAGGARSRRLRNIMNFQSRLVLNIPQDPDWGWVSSMRVLAAWRCGRAVVNLGSGLGGKIAKFCENIPANTGGYSELGKVLGKYEEIFHAQRCEYENFVSSKENGLFPEATFRIWSLMENLDG